MLIINKNTKEEIEADFLSYKFNPEKKQKEAGITIVDTADRTRRFRYDTLDAMNAEWEDKK